MDSLPIELISLIFTFLVDWPFELRSLLSARRVCRVFWQASMRDEVWVNRFHWGNEALDSKFENQSLYKKKMFQHRLLVRYCKFMGCYNSRIWELSKEEVVESYAHSLRLSEYKELAFVDMNPPIICYRLGRRMCLGNKRSNHYNMRERDETFEELKIRIARNFFDLRNWPRTKKTGLVRKDILLVIPTAFHYRSSFRDRVLDTSELVEFGLFVESKEDIYE